MVPHRATEKDGNNSGLLIEAAFGEKKENEREMKEPCLSGNPANEGDIL